MKERSLSGLVARKIASRPGFIRMNGYLNLNCCYFIITNYYFCTTTCMAWISSSEGSDPGHAPALDCGCLAHQCAISGEYNPYQKASRKRSDLLIYHMKRNTSIEPELEQQNGPPSAVACCPSMQSCLGERASRRLASASWGRGGGRRRRHGKA